MTAEAFPHQEELVLGLFDMGEIVYLKPPGQDVVVANREYPREEFTKLKSGRKSPHFVNARGVTSWSKSLPIPVERQMRTRDLVVDGLGWLLDEQDYDHLLGFPMAVTCLSGAIAQARRESVLWMREPTAENQKKYGMHKMIEGHFATSERVATNDNVVTDSKTKTDGAAVLEAAGLEVVSMNVLVDREEGGKEALEAAGYTFAAVVGMQAISDILFANRKITAQQHGWAVEYRRRVLSGEEDAVVAEEKAREAELK